MKRLAVVLVLLAACGSNHTKPATDAHPHGDGGSQADAASQGCGAACPTGYSCGSANGIAVCRSDTSHIPLFTHVYVIVMENTTLSTLQAAIDASPSKAPNLKAIESTYASASDYHGVAHPSLPNYIAMTSGGTQGITCDCEAQPNQGTCNAITCLTGCTCDQNAQNFADQLEAASKTWMDFGEDMGTPCNLVDSGKYAQRHNPFLYYDDIQGNATRCNAHVVDFSSFDVANPPDFTFIAPNLDDDMHDPVLGDHSTNIANGDAWIGPQVQKIVDSTPYKSGGLLIVVWDEDDNSGGLGGTTDDPIAMFLMSPYAKSGGYVSSVKADHYSMLATFEDGLDVPRLGQAGQSRAGMADTLADLFPAQ